MRDEEYEKRLMREGKVVVKKRLQKAGDMKQASATSKKLKETIIDAMEDEPDFDEEDDAADDDYSSDESERVRKPVFAPGVRRGRGRPRNVIVDEDDEGYNYEDTSALEEKMLADVDTSIASALKAMKLDYSSKKSLID
jgi:DNA-directed RNA polymerase specialized sigma24 family protein